MRKNDFDTPETSLVARMAQQENSRAGCSKRPDFSPAQPRRAKTRLLPSKPTGESKPEAYHQEYVEECDEPRTKLTDFFSILQGRELPDSERTAIEMDELRVRIIPHPTILQPQRGMAKLAKLDTRNIEVERLPLDM